MLKELHNKLTKESEQVKQEKAEQRQRKVIPLVSLVTILLIDNSGRDFKRNVGALRCCVVDPFSNRPIPGAHQTKYRHHECNRS